MEMEMMMMWEERRDGERETEKEGREKQEKTEGRERGERDRETPNTYALAQTTLKITNGCLCRGPKSARARTRAVQHGKSSILASGFQPSISVHGRA